ncbi:class I SAM-dependent methyltransferase [Vibrio mimicus]
MPVSLFYRSWDYYELDRIALDRCRGTTLDIGAGTGVHTIELQKRGMDVTALDSSQNACTVLRKRGVSQVVHGSIQDFSSQRCFDTWLLLGRSIGLVSSLAGFQEFLSKAASSLCPKGRLIFNSVDVTKPSSRKMWFSYQGQNGIEIDWFNVNIETARSEAENAGFTSRVLHQSDDGNYLIELELM